jgi:hypothetical protein
MKVYFDLPITSQQDFEAIGLPWSDVMADLNDLVGASATLVCIFAVNTHWREMTGQDRYPAALLSSAKMFDDARIAFIRAVSEYQQGQYRAGIEQRDRADGVAYNKRRANGQPKKRRKR